MEPHEGEARETRLTRPADLLRVGPWVLLLPLAVLAFGVLQVRERHRASAPAVAAPHFDAPTEVAGFAGVLERGDERLAFRLVPLHGDGGRQDFEARSLRRRLDLGEGQPWRLSLRRQGVAPSTGTPSVEVRVNAVRAGPLRLRPIERALDADGAVDPVGVLFAGSHVRLEGPREGALLLWGPRPSRTLELELELELDGVRRVAALAPASLAVAAGGAVLARIESKAGSR